MTTDKFEEWQRENRQIAADRLLFLMAGIFDAVAQEFAVGFSEITAHGKRKAHVVEARYAVWWIANQFGVRPSQLKPWFGKWKTNSIHAGMIATRRQVKLGTKWAWRVREAAARVVWERN